MPQRDARLGFTSATRLIDESATRADERGPTPGLPVPSSHAPSFAPLSIIPSNVGDFIQAPETLALVLPTLSLIPAVFFAAWIYLDPALECTPCSPDFDPPAFNPVTHAYLGRTPILEPFSTATNLSYWTSGVAVLLYSVPNGAFLHPQMYVLAVLFVLLGAGSAMMHASGGQLDSWPHAMDILCIYALFIALASTAALGLMHAALGRSHAPGLSCAAVATVVVNVATMALLAWCVVLWREIDQQLYLLATGGVIIGSNSATKALFAFRAEAARGSSLAGASRAALFHALRAATPRLVVLGCALYVNLGRRDAVAAAQRACHLATSAEAVRARIEAVAQRDFAHGAWHYLSSSALLAMALSSQEGLDGAPIDVRARSRRAGFARAQLRALLGVQHGSCGAGRAHAPPAAGASLGAGEGVSSLLSMAYALATAMLFATGASSRAWLRFFLATSLTALPTRAALQLVIAGGKWTRRTRHVREHARTVSPPEPARTASDSWRAGVSMMERGANAWRAGCACLPERQLSAQAPCMQSVGIARANEAPPAARLAVARATAAELRSLGELRIHVTPAVSRVAMAGQPRTCGHRRCHSLPVARSHVHGLRDVTNSLAGCAPHLPPPAGGWPGGSEPWLTRK